MFHLSDFQYDLPVELVARYPLSQRTASRLLCLNKTSGQCEHKQFTDLLQLLNPGDLLVFNDTRVIPARLFGNKSSGGKIEILVERILNANEVLVQLKASKSPKSGAKIILEKGITAEILDRENELFKIKIADRSVLEVLDEIGHVPVPPYFDRSDETIDQERYQTVYAKNPGAVAAPTAGLHFDEALLDRLKSQGIETTFITLHVGSGTFQPVRVENIKEHVMHAEYAEINPNVWQQIIDTKNKGNRVIAVGTTAVRALETAAQQENFQGFQGNTNIFIYPGFQFRCIDAMITNFHLPKSTLLMLVCAFAGYEKTMKAYQAAIENRYRFFSYGDAMWIE